ncbi:MULTISPECIES: integration host factor subunit alpha [Acidithiobacillus]|uniref:Integration host factor subunit alpha n=2 Tax=Acidithiobacillus TaxID=119977 RepID=A0A179BQP6_ACIFR|nr:MULTISPECIES: integration host factor subunit alpha [Acidithiobacillus]MEB8488189.1 integration host factor subunit alpha [Acidithiobacillus ferriphilus]MEB8488775.1 integration host factor subunit alpha [Acidithiobacillus ferriphilus]MEB8492219.1 integration host factor subunit alpha [Acidithiobacillus ferriphilus]MEB8513522.1 integration host factor subunit alpha [Acidithiobacillus ferriphilus]MEB8521664.1 integration host factor subunit alpha [Acidithiobacillus ferriphilus]
MTVTKNDLVREVVDATGLTATDSKKIVDTLFNTMRATLASGEEVKLSGFGNFTLRDKRPRPGRNPKTGEPVEISARRVVTYRCSLLLREKCGG